MFNIGDKVYHFSNSFRNLEVTKSNNIYTFCRGEEYLRATRNNPEGWYTFSERRFLNVSLKGEEYNNNKNYYQSNKWDKIANRAYNMYTKVSYVYEQVLNKEIDLNPFYQRDLVWTLEQKKNYIENLFLDKAVITPTFILNWENFEMFAYEILDGKQRLSTIFEFIENKFSVFDNIYFKDLSQNDVNFLLSHGINYTRIDKRNNKNFTDTEKIELFLEINELGSKMSDEHIQKIKSMLKK